MIGLRACGKKLDGARRVIAQVWVGSVCGRKIDWCHRSDDTSLVGQDAQVQNMTIMRCNKRATFSKDTIGMVLKAERRPLGFNEEAE